MTSEFNVRRPTGARIVSRAWGLAMIKSAYGEMYPDCHVQFVTEISKRIEQNMFTKTKSPQDYQDSVMNTVNSIRALAGSSARSVAQQCSPGDGTVKGNMDLFPNRFTQCRTGRTRGQVDMTTEPFFVPDPSDVIKLVPFILEAGVQVLGKIETVQQVRSIGDGKKSTIGFLASEMLCKVVAHSERGISAAPSTSTNRSLDKSNVPFSGCSLNDGITVTSIRQPPRGPAAQQQTGTCQPNFPSLRSSMRNLSGLDGFDNRGVNDLRDRRAMHQETPSTLSMSFAELKAKYGEKIETLLPLIETQLGQLGEEKIVERRLVRDRIAFVHAALKQDDIASPDTLRSLENIVVQIFDNFGFMLNDEAICNSIGHHHVLENVDDYEELGETDSETEDDDNEEGDPEEEFEQQEYGFVEHDLLVENEQQPYIPEEGEIYEDNLEEDEFAEDYRDENLARGPNVGRSLPINSQASIEVWKEPGIVTKPDSTAEQELEFLHEIINEQKSECGLEPIPLAGKNVLMKDEPAVQFKTQVPGIEESKTEDAQGLDGSEDAFVPVLTPRRSLRIRSKASISRAQANFTEKNIDNSMETTHSTKGTPTTTPKTRKTPQKPSRKTPRK